MYAVHGTALSLLIGLPRAAPVSGRPVFASTFADTATQIGLMSSHDFGSPPGMSDGPNLAPSSPPETPRHARGPVVDGHLEAVVGHVQREVRAHHGQPDQAHIRRVCRRS